MARKVYLITPDGDKVLRFIGARKAQEAAKELPEGTIAAKAPEELEQLTANTIIALHNRAQDSEENHVGRFSNKSDGIEKTWPLLDKLAENYDAPAEKTSGGGDGKRGRRSSLYGNRVFKNQKENPRRPGTLGFQAWELIVDGMTVEEFVEKTKHLPGGGGLKHLKWDLDRDRLRLESVS